MTAHETLINALRTAQTMPELHTASGNAADILEAIYTNLLPGVRKLRDSASHSLINDELDETQRGHRLGVIEVCEAILLMA